MKALITTSTKLAKSISTFQNGNAKTYLEAHHDAAEEAGTEVEKAEIKDGVITVTIADGSKADKVVEFLKEYKCKSSVGSRKEFLRQRIAELEEAGS